jgi:hypothetical protein
LPRPFNRVRQAGVCPRDDVACPPVMSVARCSCRIVHQDFHRCSRTHMLKHPVKD